MTVCVIPARGGSKRIARKNLREFCGKPMLVWSIEAALESGCFAAVMLSTEDEEIAELARAHGAEVPFVRPAELADDYATTGAVMAHAVAWLAEKSREAQEACCLYATAPFVQAQDLRDGLQRLRESQAEYVFSVTDYAFPIQRALRLQADGSVAMFQPEQFQTRSQDLEQAYHDAGQFYWGKSAAWLSAKPVFESALPLILPSHRVQDIDTEEDWRRAEWLFKAMLASR
ncbi:MAG: pseudaminic acid cytidylyltransferase [Gammaproteobacteria bacterium]|nr:pseudaminic acid cytidylyltransferase [Gammaproteobacteria bacterium]